MPVRVRRPGPEPGERGAWTSPAPSCGGPSATPSRSASGTARSVVPYLNRLSDLCWLLARSSEQEHLTARAGRRAGPPSKGMMPGMHLPLTLADRGRPSSAPDSVERSAGGPSRACELRGPGLELDVAWCEQRRFKAKTGETARGLRARAGAIDVVLGLGRASSSSARRRCARRRRPSPRSTGEAKSVALDLTGDRGARSSGPRRPSQAAIEGFLGARYRFTRYHAGDPDPLESLTIVVATEEVAAAERGLERGRVIADATWLAGTCPTSPPAP